MLEPVYTSIKPIDKTQCKKLLSKRAKKWRLPPLCVEILRVTSHEITMVMPNARQFAIHMARLNKRLQETPTWQIRNQNLRLKPKPATARHGWLWPRRWQVTRRKRDHAAYQTQIARIKPGHLPTMLRVIAELDGVDVAIHVAEKLGGTRLWLPKNGWSRDAAIAKIVSPMAADALCNEIGAGITVNVPTARTVINWSKVTSLREAGHSYNQIAVATKLSHRQILRICKGIKPRNLDGKND